AAPGVPTTPDGGLWMIRVLLADDHALVRGGFRALLSTLPGVKAVAEAATGNEARALSRRRVGSRGGTRDGGAGARAAPSRRHRADGYRDAGAQWPRRADRDAP